MNLLAKAPVYGVMIAALCLVLASVVTLVRLLYAKRRWKKLREEYNRRKRHLSVISGKSDAK
ncbi:hypothetical protein [Herbaspirillum lusitanum]|uniref:hypothetical protein n=1 Tax=Herbaspirillum lusitanum TaxID=213312 RepID=UPI00223788EB|nr:hypothetical protein [Herbaspirillum lusitanum]